MATAARKRPSRASRAADAAQAGKPDLKPVPDQPEPAAQPYALLAVESYPKLFYRPAIKVCVPSPDGGETVEVIDHCEHMDKYGHDSEKAALACARRIAAQRGVKLAK